MPKLYYFSHPYTGNAEENFKLANARSLKLIKSGYYIISPITHSHPLDQLEKHDLKFWMNLDQVIMSHCDGIILAPNWETSKGCRLELRYFIKSDKEILKMDKEGKLKRWDAIDNCFQ